MTPESARPGTAGGGSEPHNDDQLGGRIDAVDTTTVDAAQDRNETVLTLESLGLTAVEIAECERKGGLSDEELHAEVVAEIERRDAAFEKLIDEHLAADPEQSETCFKKVRGMARRSLDLIAAMYAAAEAARPITGRGVGYKLFTLGLISSMSGPNMQRVYRLLKVARERDMIPWSWIVDETRELERASSWNNPAEFIDTVSRAYRRDYWSQQPARVEVVSEKGTIRGVLAPVLDSYGVGFRVMHGFSSATTVHDLSQDDDGRPLILLYVGDYDPSGLYMSESDLPGRLAQYGGDHIVIKRIALRREQLDGLPSFPASDKKKDPRYGWFSSLYGQLCWELDALDPNKLRSLVEEAIQHEIEPVAWERCKVGERAERESMRTVLDSWRAQAAGGLELGSAE